MHSRVVNFDLSPPLFATFNFTLFPRWIKLPCFDLKSQSDTITSWLYQEKMLRSERNRTCN